MKVHHIAYRKTGYFSNLICDYLAKEQSVTPFYTHFPSFEGFSSQIKLKSGFDSAKRTILVDALNEQNKTFELSKATKDNISALQHSNTYTITTGHQLNIFTGPLYFLYKIVSTIKLSEQLKKEFPDKHFVPIYWMATEDHDYAEIQYFNFRNKKISWLKDASGAVGRLNTDGAATVFDEFQSLLGDGVNAEYLKKLFNNAYGNHSCLTDATRYLVNELFKSYGLVIIDGDAVALKKVFIPQVKDEILNQKAFKTVVKSNQNLSAHYKIQVNPRAINLFYLKDGLRERIIFEDNMFTINNTSLVFTEKEILVELENYPERFSPNVIMRPLYQETILPNLCYIGGGGELAYWFQLKDYFEHCQVPFPIVLLRNSALFISEKQVKKLNKLAITLEELFLKRADLIDKKIKELSDINIDFSDQRIHLQAQFDELKALAAKTDKSFSGAVNAQEKKQLNGLDKLEKRLLKAQKRKMKEIVDRIIKLHEELFPNESLEERFQNFSSLYMELGDDLIPTIYKALEPLNMNFSVIEY